MKKFDNALEAVEDKPCIEEYRGGEKEKRNTQMYFFVNLNPFPTYKKLQSKVLEKDTKIYNKKPQRSQEMLLQFMARKG